MVQIGQGAGEAGSIGLRNMAFMGLNATMADEPMLTSHKRNVKISILSHIKAIGDITCLILL